MQQGSTNGSRGTLDVLDVVRGARLVVLGGTGFLGKIFWAMLLDRYPEVERIYLVVRPKGGGTPEARFWREIAPSEVLEPLRRTHGDGFEAFLRDKVVPIDGDIEKPSCGLDEALVAELSGTIDAVVNVAGIIDFNPPLDEAIGANAFGAQNLVNLARARRGDLPHEHLLRLRSAAGARGRGTSARSPLPPRRGAPRRSVGPRPRDRRVPRRHRSGEPSLPGRVSPE